MIKLLVTGDPDFNNYPFMEEKLNHLLSKVNKDNVVLIYGTRGRAYSQDKIGVDGWVNWYSFEHWYNSRIFHPHQSFGPKTKLSTYNDTLKKNLHLKQMADDCNVAAIFTNGGDLETQIVIDHLIEAGKKPRIYAYPPKGK